MFLEFANTKISNNHKLLQPSSPLWLVIPIFYLHEAIFEIPMNRFIIKPPASWGMDVSIDIYQLLLLFSIISPWIHGVNPNKNFFGAECKNNGFKRKENQICFFSQRVILHKKVKIIISGKRRPVWAKLDHFQIQCHKITLKRLPSPKWKDMPYFVGLCNDCN